MSGRSPRWFTGIKPVAVTITIVVGSYYSSTKAYVTIDGVKYTAAATIDVPFGTNVDVTVAAARNSPAVYLDGTRVLSSPGTYTWVADKPATITMRASSSSGSSSAGIVEIVTG